jgi:hypothetical protein
MSDRERCPSGCGGTRENPGRIYVVAIVGPGEFSDCPDPFHNPPTAPEAERLRRAIDSHRVAKWPRGNYRYDDYDAALYRAAGVDPYENARAALDEAHEQGDGERCGGSRTIETGEDFIHGSRVSRRPCPGCPECNPPPPEVEVARLDFIDAAADYFTNRSPGCQWAREDCIAKLAALERAYEAEEGSR